MSHEGAVDEKVGKENVQCLEIECIDGHMWMRRKCSLVKSVIHDQLSKFRLVDMHLCNGTFEETL